MSAIRLGFIGVGGMGQCAHLRNYAQLADCQVAALAEPKAELGRKVAQRYGIPHVYADHRQLLAEAKVDALVCVQQFDTHGGLLPEVYQAGVPVLTEKPLCGSLEVSRGLLRALAASKASHYVAYHKRSDPATMWARRQTEKWLADGEVGAMQYVRITMPPGDWIAGGFAERISTDEKVAPAPKDAKPQNMTQQAFEQYIRFVNYYIHQVNLLRHLLGEDYRVEFADRAGRVLVARSVTGVTGVIEMQPYATTIDWQEAAMICFERGWIKLELPAPVTINRCGRVTAYCDPGKGVEPRTITPTLPWVDAMQQQARNYLAAIRGENTPLCMAEEAMKDLQIAGDYLALLNDK